MNEPYKKIGDTVSVAPLPVWEPLESAAFMFFKKRVIGGSEDPYLVRFIVAQTPWFSIYIHKLCRSDYERALHDHPWSFVSFILWNGYHEVHNNHKHATFVLWEKTLYHRPGSFIFRPARWRHRVVIKGKPAWTLVFTGARTRKWGFWPNGIWCHWKKFNINSGICESAPIEGKVGLD